LTSAGREVATLIAPRRLKLSHLPHGVVTFLLAMMESECRNSERNEELKAFEKDGKQVIGKGVSGKERKKTVLSIFF
jgi:hypothetical protein